MVGCLAYTVLQAELNRFSGGSSFYGYRLTLEMLAGLAPALALSAHRMGRVARGLFGPVAVVQVAMIGTGSWTPGGIRQAAPDLKFEFWPVPGANGTPYWAGAVSPGYAINAKAKDPQAAEKWVEFLQSKKAAQIYNKETGTIMTTKDFTPVVDPSLAKMVDPVRKGDFYLPAVSWPTNSDVLSTTSVSLMQQNILGKITPEQFAKGMDTELQSVK